MKPLPPCSVLVTALLLASCSSAPTNEAIHGGHDPRAAEALRVEDMSAENAIAFRVLEDNQPVKEFSVTHTKQMHLIVVRDDLRHFHHLHPEMDADGVWRTAFTPPEGGPYWLYADFASADGTPHTIRWKRQYPGDRGLYVIEENHDRKKTVDGYDVELAVEESGSQVEFTYTVRGADGKPVRLEEYLGATGHSVILSTSGDFIHTHPIDDVATPVFAIQRPKDDFYRLFTQFQIKGKVLTIDFGWRPESAVPGTTNP